MTGHSGKGERKMSMFRERLKASIGTDEADEDNLLARDECK